jgi:prepilin-type N-terminal cleavage/methylation domain-containing protein
MEKMKSWRQKYLENDKGFTLIEIIAVLVILGILAAVALPKYIEVIREAKVAMAKSQVAEMKSSLNMAYAKLFMSNGTQPANSADLVTTAGFTSGTAVNVGSVPDIWNVTLTTAGTTSVTLSINSRNSDNEFKAAGTWNLPQ